MKLRLRDGPVNTTKVLGLLYSDACGRTLLIYSPILGIRFEALWVPLPSDSLPR